MKYLEVKILMILSNKYINYILLLYKRNKFYILNINCYKKYYKKKTLFRRWDKCSSHRWLRLQREEHPHITRCLK